MCKDYSGIIEASFAVDVFTRVNEQNKLREAIKTAPFVKGLEFQTPFAIKLMNVYNEFNFRSLSSLQMKRKDFLL